MNYCDEKELRKLEAAKAFLGKLLNETLEWSCTDFQHEHAKYFVEILGEHNTPYWMREKYKQER